MKATDEQRTEARVAYEKVLLPPGLTLQSKSETGDPIDSPDNAGWQYKYVSSGQDAGQLYAVFQQNLKDAGYTITAAMNPSQYDQKRQALGDYGTVATYYVAAGSANGKITIGIKIDNKQQVFVTTVAVK